MKHALYALFLALALVSCGTDSRHFKIDGRLLNINQGEFYVYSPDGVINGLDTIKVQAGRFTYEVECDHAMTLMIVFPNFTEQPVFAVPGKSVDIKGDASHLKLLTVKGTKDNELMNDFREQIANASPTEINKYACTFIEDHPESPVGTYLVRRYFIQTSTQDFPTASRLIATMLAKQPDNTSLRTMQRIVAGKTSNTPGANAPSFTAYDINGRPITNATLSATPYVAIVAWASWNYNSLNMLRIASNMQKDSQGRVSIVSICLDYDVKQCRRAIENNGFNDIPTICDGKSVDGSVYNTLGLANIPDNIIFHNGKVVDVSLPTEEFRNKLKID